MKKKLWFSIGLLLIIMMMGAYQATPVPLAVQQAQAIELKAAATATSSFTT